MTLGKGIAPFHAVAKLKQKAQPKNLMSQIKIPKEAHQIVKYAYHKIAHFFNRQNDQHLGAAIIFDCFTPFTALKITNDSL